MISVSDVLKLLEKIPVLGTLSKLPERVKLLEQKVASLEAAGPVPGRRPCPACGQHMTYESGGVVQEENGKAFRTYKCESCGKRERGWFKVD